MLNVRMSLGMDEAIKDVFSKLEISKNMKNDTKIFEHFLKYTHFSKL